MVRKIVSFGQFLMFLIIFSGFLVQETKENFQKELEKAKETEKNLEEDKKNLIQEVSRSKQAALQIVKVCKIFPVLENFRRIFYICKQFSRTKTRRNANKFINNLNKI